MKISTHAGLIGAAMILQSIVLASGWFLTFRIVQHTFARVIQDRVIEQNLELAERVTALFPPITDGEIEYGSSQWERLQRIIENQALADLPSGAFACLIGGDGRLLCHPKIRTSPALRQYSFDGKMLLSNLNAGSPSTPIMEGDGTTSGVVEFLAGDFHYVATRPLAGSDLRLLVHQPVGELIRVGNHGTRWVMGVAGLAMLGVLGITGTGLGLLLRRYDSVHEALNRHLHENLDLARRMQQATLPDRLPSIPGLEIAGWSRPADETGGDTFDAFGLSGLDGPACATAAHVDADSVALLIADAAGHGIAPALAVTRLHAMTRLAWRIGNTLVDIARLVNEQLVDRLPDGQFITAMFAHADPRSGLLQIVSAGQGPILIRRAVDGSVESLEADTFPLGISDDLAVTDARRITLAEGDVLCAVTDGITEASNPSRVQFGEHELAELLRDSDGCSAERIAERIARAVETHAEGVPPSDDRTVLVVRRIAYRADLSSPPR